MSVSDGVNAGVEGNFTVTITDVYEAPPNSSPVFNSSVSFSVLENEVLVGTVVATDPDGDAVSYMITAGADQLKFTINVTTGVLVFTSAPDFETPLDNGGNNIYNLTVQASDGALSSVQNITVTVFDVTESTPNSAPSGLSASGDFVMQENEPVGTTVGTFLAQDADGDVLTYTLVSGAGDGNNSMFTLESNGTLKTALSFDYELYTSLSIRVSVSDGVNAGVDGSFTVTITDVDEYLPPTGFDTSTELAIEENQNVGTVVGAFQKTNLEGQQFIFS